MSALPAALQSLVDKRLMTEEDANKWVQTKEKALRCANCSLHQTATQKVYGVGDIKAPFVFVGEAPNAKDDQKGEPFWGRAGVYFRELMAKVGFQKGDVYLTNAVLCKTPDGREPHKEEYNECFFRLLSVLDVIKPKVVVAVGSIAFKVLCPNVKRSIGGLRGEWTSSYGFKIMPVWHPSYVISSKSALREKELIKDLKKAYYDVFAV